MVKNLPAMQGDPSSICASRRSPGEGNGNHSGILLGESHGQEEASRLRSMGLQRVRYDRAAKHTHSRTNQRRFLLRVRREGLPSTVTFELRPDSVRKPVAGKSLTGGGSSPPEMGPHLDGGQGRRHRDEMLLHQWFGHSFPGNPRTSPVLFQEWRSQGRGPPTWPETHYSSASM